MINSKDITVVYQGRINSDSLQTGNQNGEDFLYNLSQTKKYLPNAKIILSTWNGINLPSHLNTAEKLGIDKIIYSEDPGGTLNIKFNNLPANNANRQIVSSHAGLQGVETPYALKLRIDSFLVNDNLLLYYNKYINEVNKAKQEGKRSKFYTEDKPYKPIIVGCFFTIDPIVYEHMAYHMSDWVQFSDTATLQEWWNIPLFPDELGTYYERKPHRFNANYFDKQFRTRLAVEQYITINFAKKRGFVVPQWHNQIDEKILIDFNHFLANHIVVLDLEEFGVSLTKYSWTKKHHFISMDCIRHADWYKLFVDYWQIHPINKKLYQQGLKRQRQKRMSKLVADTVHLNPQFENYWYSAKNRKRASLIEKMIKKIP